MRRLLIIGIDSLDPRVLLAHKGELPHFSRLMDASPTFVSKSIFPVDTIPAWASISTGLNPGNHGLLYTFDVFDPNLSDLKKVDAQQLKGKTFWDHASNAGLKAVVMFPQLIYPPWPVNGVMVSKSPFDRRKDWVSTDIDLSAYPENAKDKYGIPDKIEGLWGGFPGENRLAEWAALGKKIVGQEKDLGLSVCKGEAWDVFFIYFNLLDIIQHRLWRYYDSNDPSYPGDNEFKGIIPDYYRMFDGIVGEFMALCPDAAVIVLSDHGHKSRPFRTVNINEALRQNRLIASSGRGQILTSRFKKMTLETANRLHLEHLLIKAVTKNKTLTKASKSVYSSSGSIDREKSVAYLSNFAGIKSYPHGGIVINRKGMADDDYEKVREQVISVLQGIKTNDGQPLVHMAMRREALYPGKHTQALYPDIVFELDEDYGVGWDIGGDLFGKAYDHNVASGGHRKDAVLLVHNVDREVMAKDIGIVDTMPTIMDLLGIRPGGLALDGKSILKG